MVISTPSLIFFILYGIYCVFHLVICFICNDKLRKITKPVCMLFLATASILALPNYPLIFIGPLLGAIGDLLLIWKKKLTFFIIGTIFFIGGHLCYLAQTIIYLSFAGTDVPWYFFLIIGLFLFGLVIGLYPLTKKLAGRAALLGNFYVPLQFVVAAAAIWLTVTLNIAYPGLFIALGYALFIFSDLFLIFTKFKKDIKRQDFFIMLTYLIAQFMIVFGLDLIGVLQAWQ